MQSVEIVKYRIFKIRKPNTAGIAPWAVTGIAKDGRHKYVGNFMEWRNACAHVIARIDGHDI